MIHTLSSFFLGDQSVDGFLDRHDSENWASTGAEPVGTWLVTLGGPRRVLALTCFDTLQQWRDSRRGLANDADEVIALQPLTRRMPTGSGPESEPGIYTMRTFNVALGSAQKFAQISEDGWWPWVKAGQDNVRPLAQWLSIIAPATRVYMMTRYHDMAHWEATRQVGPKPDDPRLVPVWQKAAEAIAERGAMVIDTDVCILEPIGGRCP